MYHITDYTYAKAKQYGYTVKPSKRAGKKLDVYDKTGKNYLISIGDTRYSDYPTFIKTHDKTYADERKRLYYARHTGSGLGERLAKMLLW